ncbi:unnamed protein product, partial [Candidula unifasciata]
TTQSSAFWANLPVIPPYPMCAPGYCEVLCCPAPHEIEPIIIDKKHDGEDPPCKHTSSSSLS